MAGAKSQKRFRLSRRPPSARPSRRGVCGRLLRRTHTSRAAGSKAWGSHLPSKMRLANAKPLSALTNAARMPRRAYRRNAFSETGRGIGRRRRSKNADERICHQQYIETAAAPNRRCSVSRSLKSTVSDRSPAHRVRARRLPPALAVETSPARHSRAAPAAPQPYQAPCEVSGGASRIRFNSALVRGLEWPKRRRSWQRVLGNVRKRMYKRRLLYVLLLRLTPYFPGCFVGDCRQACLVL